MWVREITYLLALVVSIALASASAAELAAPNPALTPGAIISNDRETACTFRATPRLYQTDRSVYFEQAQQVFERYGIPYDQHREYELDHLIPRCLGGTDSVLNEWPEPLAEATIKHAEEARICRAVCDERTMTLEAGRRFFTTGQWRHRQ